MVDKNPQEKKNIFQEKEKDPTEKGGVDEDGENEA